MRSKPESAVLGAQARDRIFICSAFAPVLVRSSSAAVQRAANTAQGRRYPALGAEKLDRLST
jgi:hypothetical protein